MKDGHHKITSKRVGVRLPTTGPLRFLCSSHAPLTLSPPISLVGLPSPPRAHLISIGVSLWSLLFSPTLFFPPFFVERCPLPTFRPLSRHAALHHLLTPPTPFPRPCLFPPVISTSSHTRVGVPLPLVERHTVGADDRAHAAVGVFVCVCALACKQVCISVGGEWVLRCVVGRFGAAPSPLPSP